MNWNDGKLRGFCDGIMAEAKINVQLDNLKKALKIADKKILAQCSLEQN